MNTSPDHPDFTALALGEHIHGMPAQAVLEALRTSVAARNEAEQIRATANCLAFVLKGQPPLRLDATRRNAILNADITGVRARFAEEERAARANEPFVPVERAPRTWIYPTLAAAAVAAAAMMVMKFLPAPASLSPPNTAPVVHKDDELNGRMMVVPPTPQSPVRERAHVPTPETEVVDQAVKPPLPVKGLELPPAGQPAVHVVKDSPPSIPSIPAPRSPATHSPPPEAVAPPDGISPPRKPVPDNWANPPRNPGKRKP